MEDQDVDAFVPTSLKELTKNRWMKEMIGPLLQDNADAWFIMVADEVSMQMIGSSCTVDDLTDNRIALLESIEKLRMPFVGLDVVYVLEPTAESVSKFIADWDEDGEEPYMHIHVYFLSTCPDKELDRIAKMRGIERVITCKEVNIAYQPVDSHGYTLGFKPDEYQYMFGRGARPENLKIFTAQMINAVVSLCASLGERPKYVRCWNSPARSRVKELGAHIRQRLDEWPLKLPDSETTVLIMDRTFDMVTPFMDHWCWGHMIQENFNIDISNPACWGLFTAEGEKPCQVDEDDYAFQQLRFMLYNVAKKSFVGLQDENSEAYPSAARMQAMGGFSKLANDDPLKANALKELVQYRDNGDKIKFHTQLGRKMKSFEARVEDLIQYMQACAMGEDSVFADENQDKKIKRWEKCAKILEDRTKFTKEQREKALLCYVAGVGSITEKEKEFLHKFDRADQTDYVALVNKMEEGFATGKAKRKKEKLKNRDERDFRVLEQLEKYSMDSWRYPEVQEARSQILDKASLYNRWTPKIRRIIEAALLDTEKWHEDYKKNMPLAESKKAEDAKASKEAKEAAEGEGGKRANRTAASSVGVEMQEPEGFANLHQHRGRYQGKQFIPGKVIVFIMGGFCHAELQAVYEAVAQHSLDVYIGGTHMMTGKGFVEAVRFIKSN
eukprot:TRINITY_DN1118_c0_g1_i15.p1 TRINITY_DN1118_c0_g1~~TRINITY_DN1118_c0_g1_i15.p1  ORF type:complete len:669 (-),score=214.05 TRINITY_DN1118_c0_g1_i15:284-2290(-)